MWRFLICFILPFVCVSNSCLLPNLPDVITVKENTVAEFLLLNVSTSDNITLVHYVNKSAPFIEAREGSLYVNATVDLDNNTAWCQKFLWTVWIKCASQPDSTPTGIDILVELTDDFPPQFTTPFNTSVRELTSINTTVFDMNLHKDTVTDSDCRAGDQSDKLAFGLQSDGNTNNAFRMQNILGNIVVNRLLDFENGDTHFLLNVSVGTQNDNRTSYTTLDVNIIDIDDSDPKFNDSVYTFDVVEEDNSSVFVWNQTLPPVAAYDQDVQVNDPLTFSLFNSTDEDILKINNMTGEVQLQRAIDREKEPSRTVILKVEQVTSSRRSATATLTINVIDINDNRPLFARSSYDVTIAEHSARGVTVAYVTATDMDDRENAVFNYTLQEGNDTFDITTVIDVISQQRIGVVTVKDPAWLDRKNYSELHVVVGTLELKPENGGDCSNGNCTANITVTVSDINDNSPQFPNMSYTLIVRNNVDNVVIGSITATDADEGDNANLTYSMNPYGSSDCSMVTINTTTGDVTLIHMMKPTEVCTALVQACDNPVVTSLKRCTSVPISVSLPPDVIVNITFYSAHVAENLPNGTLVLQLQVYDKAFTMTDNNFELRNGLVVTKAELDREEGSGHQLTIATNNKYNDNITVNVTVLDVNDNSPKFLNTSTKEITLDITTTAGQVIATVTASDRDEGNNGAISYSLLHSSSSDYFSINSTRGEIRLERFPDLSIDSLDLMVIATDGGSPNLSTVHQLTVFTAAGNGSVRLEAPAPQAVLKADQEMIQNELSTILGIDVRVENIAQLPPTSDRSYVYISGKNSTSSLTKRELQQLVNDNQARIAALLERYRQKYTADDNDFTPPLIALIVVSAVLLIALIIAIFLISRKNKSHKRQSHLIQSLSRKNTLYDNANVSKMEGRTPVLDVSDDDRSGVGVVNPLYHESGSSTLEITPRSEAEVTSQKEVMSGEGGIPSESERRGADADSGVPSDRENGGASDTDSNDSKGSPITARSEGAGSRHSGGTSYLDAVLNDPLLRNGVINADDDDMVDVTMPPTDYHLDDAPEDPQLNDDQQTQPPEEPLADFEEEQETTIHFVEKDTEEINDPGEINDPTEASSGPEPQAYPGEDSSPPEGDNASVEEDEESDEVAMPMSGLALAMLNKPPTPPMVHKHRSQEEEEELPPDEPEPDYAKKVRFSVEVIEHYSNDDADKPDAGGGADDNHGPARDSEDMVEVAPDSPTGEKPIQEIDGSLTELKDDDEPTFHFNMEEMTAL